MDYFKDENIWLYLPLILWISGIFYLSSNKGSISNTSRFISPVFNFLFPESNQETRQTYHLYIRKVCHFLGYGILALFASITFYNSSFNSLAKFWYVWTLVLVLTVASIDEIKQSYNANRHGSVADVVLDCTGGLTTTLLFWVYTLAFF